MKVGDLVTVKNLKRKRIWLITKIEHRGTHNLCKLRSASQTRRDTTHWKWSYDLEKISNTRSKQ